MKKCLLMDQLCKMEDGMLTATRSRLQTPPPPRLSCGRGSRSFLGPLLLPFRYPSERLCVRPQEREGRRTLDDTKDAVEVLQVYKMRRHGTAWRRKQGTKKVPLRRDPGRPAHIRDQEKRENDIITAADLFPVSVFHHPGAKIIIMNDSMKARWSGCSIINFFYFCLSSSRSRTRVRCTHAHAPGQRQLGGRSIPIFPSYSHFVL